MKPMVTLSALAAAACLGAAMPAEANNRLVVYVECSNPKQPDLPLFKGTGVVISEEGHVLTAEHVVPEGYECVGSLENNTIAKRQLQVDFKDFQLSEKIDGKLLRFIPSSGEVFDYATYCPVVRESVGEVIVVKGFHGKSRGLPSATLGILSTYIADSRGILETDAQTVGGKSGGPVFLHETDTIIGIVAGAEFDPSGLPAYYGVLSAEALLQFGILQMGSSCGGRAPESANEAPSAEASTDAAAEPVQAAAVAEVAEPATEVSEQPQAAAAAPEAPAPVVADADAAPEPDVPPEAAEAALGMTKSDKVLVQRSLTALGFSTGGIDGIWGNRTRQAIAAWQRVRGEAPTGYVSADQTKVLISSAADILEEQRKEQEVAAALAVTKPQSSGSSSAASAENLYNQAYVLYDQGQYQKAIKLLDEAIALAPNNATYLAERGLNYLELRRTSNAIADLSKSLSIQPNNSDALSARGWGYYDIDQVDRAHADFKKAIQVDPTNEAARDGLDELCDFKGKC